MCLHCLRSTCDFFWRQTRTKPYRELADIVQQTPGYHAAIMLSSRPPYINLKVHVRWHCGSRKKSVPWLCICCVIISMGLKGHPCSFLVHILNRVSKSCDDKSCYENASALCWTWSQVQGLMIPYSPLRLCIF